MVSALAESEQREIAARDLANNWARTDPEAAIAWLESEPASASRDKAAAQIVEVASEFYPERALSLAKGIADQEVRERLLEETVSNLARRDPELAEEYVESAELGDRWNESLERERALQESFQNASEP